MYPGLCGKREHTRTNTGETNKKEGLLSSDVGRRGRGVKGIYVPVMAILGQAIFFGVSGMEFALGKYIFN